MSHYDVTQHVDIPPDDPHTVQELLGIGTGAKINEKKFSDFYDKTHDDIFICTPTYKAYAQVTAPKTGSVPSLRIRGGYDSLVITQAPDADGNQYVRRPKARQYKNHSSGGGAGYRWYNIQTFTTSALTGIELFFETVNTSGTGQTDGNISNNWYAIRFQSTWPTDERAEVDTTILRSSLGTTSSGQVGSRYTNSSQAAGSIPFSSQISDIYNTDNGYASNVTLSSAYPVKITFILSLN
tara:strand:- start:4615 stop:5331 length:717 start_codon:yes stop_codon:yes gene_type:complete